MISKVRHRQTGVEYALKTIQLEKMTSKLAKEMRNEIEILKRLDHPNIIREFKRARQSAGVDTGERGWADMREAAHPDRCCSAHVRIGCCCYCVLRPVRSRAGNDRSERHVFRSRFCSASQQTGVNDALYRYLAIYALTFAGRTGAAANTFGDICR